jgi:hypothetical protein
MQRANRTALLSANRNLCLYYYSSLILFPLFATSIVDTGGKFVCEYLCGFSKKFEVTRTLFSGARGKVIHEKNLKQKSP